MKSYVDIFAKGKWKESETTYGLKFGRVNEFPGAITAKAERRIAKIIAAEAPRGIGYKRDPGTFNNSIATQMAIRFGAQQRYSVYRNKGIFEEDYPFPVNHEYELRSLVEDYDAATDPVEKIEAVRFISEYLSFILSKYRPYIDELPRTTNREVNALINAGALVRMRWRDPLRRQEPLAAYARQIQRLIAVIDKSDRRPKHAQLGDYESVFGVRPSPHPKAWAPTITVTAQMDINLARLEKRDKIISVCGTAPRRMANLVTDGKIFERAIPEHGASLLIDGSGSMSISSETIMKIMQLAPASIIAMYYGGDGTLPFTHKYHEGGFIVVIGKDGQACSIIDEYRLGGGNYCDGLALRWLGQQPEPRYWVSDGMVTGPGDSERGSTRQDTAWCLRQFNIGWVNTNSPEAIVQILEDHLKKEAEVVL